MAQLRADADDPGACSSQTPGPSPPPEGSRSVTPSSVPSSAAAAPICPERVRHQRRTRRGWSTPPTSGSSSAPASASATSPRTAKPPRSSAIKAARAALADAGLEPRRHRPHHLRDLDARTTPSRPRRADPGRARHHARRRLRPAGGLLGLRLRASRPPTSSSTSGSHKRALVIGAETFSRILDWSDRTTCVLFGDGAGAIVLEAQEGEGTPPTAAS